MVLFNTVSYNANNQAFNLNVPKMDMHPCFKGYEAYLRDVEKDTSCLFVNTPQASVDNNSSSSTESTPVLKEKTYQ